MIDIKFMIIILFSFFMIPAIHASHIDENVDMEISDLVNVEIIEVPEIDELCDDDIEESDIIVENAIIEDEYCHENNDSIIIKSYEKSFEVETLNQYDSHIDELLIDTLSDDSDFTLNNTYTVPFYIFNDFYNNLEVVFCMELDTIFKTIDLDECLFKFKKFKEFDMITHDYLTFYNNYYCHVLTHEVNKNSILCSDKLNSKFAYCIDNSIAGKPNSLSRHVLYSNFLILNFTSMSFSQEFLTSEYFKNFYLNGCVYIFFQF